jgi:hypothetical protein
MVIVKILIFRILNFRRIEGTGADMEADESRNTPLAFRDSVREQRVKGNLDNRRRRKTFAIGPSNNRFSRLWTVRKCEL